MKAKELLTQYAAGRRNFRGAYLTGAVLTRAVLTGADLTRAVLTGAVLTGAVLTDVNLRDADLTRAVLTGAVLTGAVLTGAKLPEGVPVVDDLPQRTLKAVREHGLEMGSWHCGSTHCRAGWYITLAGHDGHALEKRMGASAAGALIYAASCPGRPIPDFYTTNTKAMASIEVDAGDPC